MSAQAVAGNDPAGQLNTAGGFAATGLPAAAPGDPLVGDITYIRTWVGWLYLATVIDLYSKEVVGWAMAEHLRTSLVCDAVTMASRNGRVNAGAVFHSDRGCPIYFEGVR